jgi:hypothetical protein
VRKPEDLDEELVKYLRESYRVGQQEAPKPSIRS